MIIKSEHRIYAMGENPDQAVEVPLGKTITFQTCDCFSDQIKSEADVIDNLDWNRINPATGPALIKEAKAGDILKVEIQDIRVGEQGVLCTIPGQGAMGLEVDRSEIKLVSIKDQMIHWDDLRMPVSPMIGVIGVAPAGESISNGEPGSHGGNMDSTVIRAGNTLYLPVWRDGAYLAMGDLHAAMGDGEIMISGVEVGGEVDVKLEVLKGWSLEEPMVEDEEYFYVIGSERTYTEAVRRTVSYMNQVLREKKGYDLHEAGMLMSAFGHLQFSQVVDPKKTLRFAIPKKILPTIE